MSISVAHITKLYGTQKALNDVSFDVHPGDIMGFLGPNGAGKSTMMKIITGFIPPNEGRVHIHGMDIDQHPIASRKIIGYLPENNPLYLDMYVWEYLDFMAGLYKLKANKAQRIEEMIALTGLGPERKKKLGQLSKGYRQRAGLAQALLHDPEVLILDEPTTGLDPNQIIEIRELISEIGREKTVMLSTHIMQEVEAICDKVTIINNGQIVASEAAGNLQALSRGQTQRIQLECREPIPYQALQQLHEGLQVKPLNENRCEVSHQLSQDLRPELFRFAVAQQLTLITLHEESRSLEHVFQELTQNQSAP